MKRDAVCLLTQRVMPAIVWVKFEKKILSGFVLVPLLGEVP